MIKEFETMFPRCLWVAKDTNYKEINDRFKLYSTSTETEIDYNEKTFKKDSSDCDAYVYLAQDKTSNKFGYLVFLIENIDVGVCAHEATHICKRMEDHFELERDANEYRAYMAEWYTKKIYEFWNEKVGVSSRTMWNALMVPNAKNVKRYVFGYDVAYDADDFSRCYDLCKFGELTLNDLRKIEQEFPYWKPLIDEWHNLVSAYKSGNYRRVNDIIDSKRDEIIEELKKQSNENH